MPSAAAAFPYRPGRKERRSVSETCHRAAGPSPAHKDVPPIILTDSQQTFPLRRFLNTHPRIWNQEHRIADRILPLCLPHQMEQKSADKNDSRNQISPPYEFTLLYYPQEIARIVQRLQPVGSEKIQRVQDASLFKQ